MSPETRTAEFALVVTDALQGQGLGLADERPLEAARCSAACGG